RKSSTQLLRRIDQRTNYFTCRSAPTATSKTRKARGPSWWGMDTIEFEEVTCIVGAETSEFKTKAELKLGFARRGLTPGRTAQPAGLWHFPHHIWQARFYDFNVWTERKRIEKLRYMYRNPVHRGFVESPEQWRWSSFRWYL